jgi:thiamine pyrophosphokinase
MHPGRSVTIDLPQNSSFSLLALHGPCRGVEVTGARWPLSDAVLESSSTLGISNESTGLLHIAVADGILTLVVP